MTTTTDYPTRPVFDAVVAGSRNRKGRTEDEVAAALGEEISGALHQALVSLVCGNLAFMRHVPARDGSRRNVWEYAVTASGRRLLAGTAEHGGPTEEELERAITEVVVHGAGRTGGAS